MNEKAKAALLESIEHWKRLASGTSRNDESIFCDSCGLCREFHINGCHHGDARQCDGCPVKNKTSFAECLHTPWQNARAVYWRLGKNSEEFREAAKKEVEFLVSLLDADTKPKRIRKKVEKQEIIDMIDSFGQKRLAKLKAFIKRL